MSCSERTKLIGIGDFGSEAIGFIKENIFSRLVDKPFLEGNEFKYALSGVSVSLNGIKALLRDVEIAVIISDDSGGINTAAKIAAQARLNGIFTVAFVYGRCNDEIETMVSACDSVILVSPDITVAAEEIMFEAVSSVIEPVYADGVVDTDLYEIKDVLSKSNKCYYTFGKGNAPEEAFKNAIESLPEGVKTDEAEKVLARIVINRYASHVGRDNIAPIMDGLCEFTNEDCKTSLSCYRANFDGEETYLLSIIFAGC